MSQGGAGASVDFDESSDAMVTVLMTQVSSLMREKKALVAEINTLARDNQVLGSHSSPPWLLLSAFLCVWCELCEQAVSMFRLGQPRNDEVAEGGLNLLAAAGSAMGAVLRERTGEKRGRCVWSTKATLSAPSAHPKQTDWFHCVQDQTVKTLTQAK